ncbi:MAG TPA: hypothetical protein VGO08_06875 [Burkholderiales bacterium]|nr:hypothetical protein [Burkholderiales bacterium]
MRPGSTFEFRTTPNKKQEMTLDTHIGAWHDKAPMCEVAAKSGVLVVAIAAMLSPEAP